MNDPQIVPLEEAHEEGRFGGKAVQLGAALRHGLPVPPGIALAWQLVDRVAAGDSEAREACVKSVYGPPKLSAEAEGGPHVGRGVRLQPDLACAVRSSAIGEDSAGASFAGQHVTRLGVRSPGMLIDAIIAAWESGRAPGALAYRNKLGLDGEPRVGVVVQQMVDAECAGVMFTKDPMTGADVRLIEAAWGLGESVVAGLVDPDRYRVRRGGGVIESIVGDKHVAVRALADGFSEEQPVESALRQAHCLTPTRLEELDLLASACERAFPGNEAHDIEWAFDRARLYLLQRRAITR